MREREEERKRERDYFASEGPGRRYDSLDN